MALTKHGNSGNWYYRFTYKNKIRFGSTKTANKSAAAKVEAAVREKLILQHEAGETESITVFNAFELLRKSRQDIKGIDGKVSKLLGTTQDTRKKPKECYGLPYDAPFESLQTKDVQRLVLYRRKEGLTDATLLHELNVIGLTITLCSNLGYSVPNIDLKKIKTDNKIKPSKGRIRYLTQDEEKRLLHELHPDTEVEGARDHQYTMRQDAYDFTVLLLDLGCRYSELSTLKLADINVPEGWLRLYRPKVDNEGVLTMTDRVKTILDRRTSAKRPGQVFLFEDKKGNARQYNPRAFKSACRRAGLEGVTPHVLRHTFASRLVQAQLPIYDISKLLGHSSVVMTSRYSHLATTQSSVTAASILNKLNGGK